MCGICGKLNFNKDQAVDPALIQQMMDTIVHRGPDGAGVYHDGPVGLGHRRLSIIDVEAGLQPMTNEDATIWVVYNGEIYNFRELRAELIGKGHQFKTSSDTEVIVHLYEEYGDQCVSRLRGMFAFALWDRARQRLLVARDRVGVKPLYYKNTGKALVFASEIKAILADKSVEPRLDPYALDRFISYYYLPGDSTLFDGIYKLDPGHYLTAEQGRIEIKQYWDLDYKNAEDAGQYAQSVGELRELLALTVKEHMISDVPVGVLLSGGVDSTGVLNYAVQQTSQPLHTFTMGFSGEQFQDERPYARMASQKFATTHHEITMTAKDFTEFLPKYAWHMEEPVCEPPAVALYFVCKLAQQNSVKVVLSGEGGDEAFGGYQTYRNFLLLERLKSASGPFKKGLKYTFQALGQSGLKKFAQYANYIEPELADYYLSRTATPSTPFNRLKRDLYLPGFAEYGLHWGERSPTQKLFAKAKNLSRLNQMLYVDTKSWLPDDLLVKADKMSMAASVELRVPLLDYKVLEFAATLPQDYKVKGWQLKRILKEALSTSVPGEILNRKKTGFPVPYDSWLRNESRELVFDTLLSDNAASKNYFHGAVIKNILDDFQSGKGNAKEVFSLLVFELWHQQFLGPTKADH